MDIVGMTVGADKEAIDAAKSAIVRIMSVPADQKTIRVALRQLTRCIQPINTTIRDCSVNIRNFESCEEKGDECGCTKI